MVSLYSLNESHLALRIAHQSPHWTIATSLMSLMVDVYLDSSHVLCSLFPWIDFLYVFRWVGTTSSNFDIAPGLHLALLDQSRQVKHRHVLQYFFLKKCPTELCVISLSYSTNSQKKDRLIFTERYMTSLEKSKPGSHKPSKSYKRRNNFCMCKNSSSCSSALWLTSLPNVTMKKLTSAFYQQNINTSHQSGIWHLQCFFAATGFHSATHPSAQLHESTVREGQHTTHQKRQERRERHHV